MKYGEATMGQTEAVINRMGGFENWLRFAGGQGKVVFETILTLLRTIHLAAQPAAVTSKEFWEGARVYSTGNNFKAQFLDLEVAATSASKLAVSRLEQNSLDVPIMTELGVGTEISVNQFRAFLSANQSAEGRFIAYLKGKDGNLWAVGAGWGAGLGWGVLASSVGARAGGVVGVGFSRKYLLRSRTLGLLVLGSPPKPWRRRGSVLLWPRGKPRGHFVFLK